MPVVQASVVKHDARDKTSVPSGQFPRGSMALRARVSGPFFPTPMRAYFDPQPMCFCERVRLDLDITAAIESQRVSDDGLVELVEESIQITRLGCLSQKTILLSRMRQYISRLPRLPHASGGFLMR
jgi:hypothetical protein